MTVTMYDSVTPTDIPADAAMVAGYVTGRYAWPESGWARFPHARVVEIATQARFNTGDVLDVEKGDASPPQAQGWIKLRKAAGLHRPTIYCSRADRADVERECHAAGYVLGVDYDLWIARYRKTAATPPWNEDGAVATQYANADTSGGHYDLSLVVDDEWPHRKPPTGGFMDALTPDEQHELLNLVREDNKVIAKSGYVEKLVQMDQDEEAKLIEILADLKASPDHGGTGNLEPGDVVAALRDALTKGTK